MIKRHELNANQTVYFYMSPKGDIIKSRRGVIDYMLEDGGYLEKDFTNVINGGKQRKMALLEFYNKMNNKRFSTLNRKKKTRFGGGQIMLGGASPAAGTDEPDPTELDIADDSEDNLGDEVLIQQSQPVTESSTKLVHIAQDHSQSQQQTVPANSTTMAMPAFLKKAKIEKEFMLPTRRSGRVLKRKRLGSSEDEGDVVVEDEPSGLATTGDQHHHQPNNKKLKQEVIQQPVKAEMSGALPASKFHFVEVQGGDIVFPKTEIKEECESTTTAITTTLSKTLPSTSPIPTTSILHAKEETKMPLPDSQSTELTTTSSSADESIFMPSVVTTQIQDIDTFTAAISAANASAPPEAVIVSKGGSGAGVTSVQGISNTSSATTRVIVSGGGNTGLLDGARLVTVTNANNNPLNPSSSSVVSGGGGIGGAPGSTAGSQVVSMLTDLVSTVSD